MTPPRFAVLPLCPLSCVGVGARVGGELRAVVVVKATFAVAHGRSGWPTQPVTVVERDQHLLAGRPSSLVSASDCAPLLGGAGVTLRGHARAPAGAPTAEMEVRLALFRGTTALVDKRVRVLGDAAEPGAPRLPFTEMPLLYERAFGGPGCAENPVGIGADGREAPNLLHPSDHAIPCCLGPIAEGWAPRAAALSMLEAEGRPGPRELAALHPAPRDQRLDRLLPGDWLVLDGFHPMQPRIQTELPAWRALAKLARTDRPGALSDLELVADTLVIDADRLEGSMVWRGDLAIASFEELASLRVYAGLDLPSARIRWPSADAPTRPAPRPALDVPPALPNAANAPPQHAPEAVLDRTADAPLPNLRPALPFVHTPAASAEEEDALAATAEVDLFKIRVALPFRNLPARSPAEVEPPARHDVAPAAEIERSALPPTPAKPAELAPIGAAPELAPAVTDAGTVRQEVLDRLAAKKPLGELDLTRADLSGVDFGESDLARLDFTGAKLSGARLSRARMVGANLGGADLSGADLAGADLSGAHLDGARLDGACLEDAKLTQASGVRTSFRQARAQNANLARGTFDEADFGDADLAGADLTAASLARAGFGLSNLERARFVDARGAGAVFDGARLGSAIATAAALAGASLRLVTAEGSKWEGATLDDATLDGARLAHARLDRASAERAAFGGADLRGANLERLAAAGASFARADLQGADLRQARLAGAVLDDADLRGAKCGGADLSGATLQRANLNGAVLRAAALQGAILRDAKLDQADLRDADLTGADLTGAALHGARIEGARMAAKSSPTNR